MFPDRYLLISFHASWQSSRIFTHSLSAGTVAFKSQAITTTTNNNKKALCKAKLGRVIALVCDGQTIRKKYGVRAGNIRKAWLNIYYYVSRISFSTCTTLEICYYKNLAIIKTKSATIAFFLLLALSFSPKKHAFWRFFTQMTANFLRLVFKKSARYTYQCIPIKIKTLVQSPPKNAPLQCHSCPYWQ